MSIAELKERLADVPGIETLTMQSLGGRQVFGFAGLLVATDPMATDQEIETAIRSASDGRMVDAVSGALEPTAAPAADVPAAPAVVPPVNYPSAMRTKTMSTGASHAGLKLKQLMEAHKAKLASMIDDNLAKVQSGFDKQMQGAHAIGTLGDKVVAEGDDLLAAVGQYANDLGIE